MLKIIDESIPYSTAEKITPKIPKFQYASITGLIGQAVSVLPESLNAANFPPAGGFG